MLGYDYIKNIYRLIPVDADSKSIQQIVFIEQLKKIDVNGNATNSGKNQSMIVLTILKKLKKQD